MEHYMNKFGIKDLYIACGHNLSPDAKSRSAFGRFLLRLRTGDLLGYGNTSRYLLLFRGIAILLSNLTLLSPIINLILSQINFCFNILTAHDNWYFHEIFPKIFSRIAICVCFFIPALVCNLLMSIVSFAENIYLGMLRTILGISIYFGIGKKWLCLPTGFIGSVVFVSGVVAVVFGAAMLLGAVTFWQPAFWVQVLITVLGVFALAVLVVLKIVFGAISLYLRKKQQGNVRVPRIIEEMILEHNDDQDSLGYNSLGISAFVVAINDCLSERTNSERSEFFVSLGSGSIIGYLCEEIATNRFFLFLDGVVTTLLQVTLVSPIINLLFLQFNDYLNAVKKSTYFRRPLAKIALFIALFVPALAVNLMRSSIALIINTCLGLWKTVLGMLVHVGLGKGFLCLPTGLIGVGVIGFGMVALAFGITMLAGAVTFWQPHLWVPIVITFVGALALVFVALVKIARFIYVAISKKADYEDYYPTDYKTFFDMTISANTMTNSLETCKQLFSICDGEQQVDRKNKRQCKNGLRYKFDNIINIFCEQRITENHGENLKTILQTAKVLLQNIDSCTGFCKKEKDMYSHRVIEFLENEVKSCASVINIANDQVIRPLVEDLGLSASLLGIVEIIPVVNY